MQRWVLVRDGHVRGYLLSESEPDAATKRSLAFGDTAEAATPPPLEEAGDWLLAPDGAGLVGDGWRLTEAGFTPPPAAETGPRIITGGDFLGLFTAAEVAGMWQSGPEFMVAALRIAAQNEVNLDSRDLARLLGLAVRRGALPAERVAAVTAGLPPA